MGGASSFYAMLCICGFLSAAWSATKISKLLGISSIVLEIATGVVLGPEVLKLIDDEYATCEHQRHTECTAPKDLYERIAKGMPLGEHLGRIANMDYCDVHAYLDHDERLSAGHGSDDAGGGGAGSLGSEHTGGDGDVREGRDPCGDGAGVPSLLEHSASLGNSISCNGQAGAGAKKDPGMETTPLEGIASSSSSTWTTTATPAGSSAGEECCPANWGPECGLPPCPEGTQCVWHGEEVGPPTCQAAAQPSEAPVEECCHAGSGPTCAFPPCPEGTQCVWQLSTWTAGCQPAAQPSEPPAQDGELPNETSGANGSASSQTSGGSSGLTLPSTDGAARRLAGGGGGGGIKYQTYKECLERSCEADVRHHCSLTPDVFTLIGHAGVALMIFESGMHFDFEKAREVGLPACVVAVIGTILPLVTGSLLVLAYGKRFMPDGIAAGTALAPTSVGISLRLLGEAGVLQEKFGQAIITAAFVDDILSLVLFNILFSLGGAFDPIPTIVFPVIGIVFMLAAMVAAVKVWPWVIDGVLLPMVPDVRDDLSTGLDRMRLTRDEVLFLLMICMLVLYGFITHLLGTHLWGCFIAGMSFACLKPEGHAHHVWVKQTKRVTTWMVRIFFACTVAFSIPVAKLLSFNAFWKGSIMGLGPCILTKVCCALFMGPARFVIGWAMVGRAEFAYLIAQMAAAANMVDEELFSIVIWALLYATIFAPLVFRYLLTGYINRHGVALKDHRQADAERADDEVIVYEDSEVVRPKERQRDYLDNERLQDLDGIDFSGFGKEKEVPRAVHSPASHQKVSGMGAAGIFPGSHRNGFLCCLFFKRIIEH